MKSYLPLLIIAGLAITSCTKDAANNASVSEASLSSMASSDGLVLMRTSDRNSSEKWNIKMNDVASKAAKEGCKTFPVNSMLVKEKHNSSGAITGYDIMFKSPGDSHADDGWVYSQTDAHGQPLSGNNLRAVSCKSCHAASSVEIH